MKYTFYMIGLSLVACFTHADTVTVRVSPAAVPELTWSTQPLGVYSVSASDQAEGPFNVLVSSNVVATGYSTSLLCPTVAVAKSKLYYRVETVSAGYSDYLILDVSGGTNAVSWPVTGTNAIPDLLTNPDYRTTKVVMRLIGSGSFKMLGVYDVTLTRPYYIGVFEMTQAQYTNMVGGVNTSINVGPTRPVDNVSFAMLRGGLADGAGYGWPTNNLVASNSIIGRVRAMTGSDNFDLPTSGNMRAGPEQPQTFIMEQTQTLRAQRTFRWSRISRDVMPTEISQLTGTRLMHRWGPISPMRGVFMTRTEMSPNCYWTIGAERLRLALIPSVQIRVRVGFSGEGSQDHPIFHI